MVSQAGAGTLIIVTGSIVAKPGRVEDALAFAQDHVARSRAEPGCISHAVYRDPQDDSRLFFFERWADMAALKTHFAVAGSRGFAAQVAEVAATSDLQIYNASETTP